VAAFDDADAGGHGAGRAQLKERAGLRAMIANIPVGGSHGLPQAGQVGFAVAHARNVRSGRLRENRPCENGRRRQDGGRRTNSIRHRRVPLCSGLLLRAGAAYGVSSADEPANTFLPSASVTVFALATYGATLAPQPVTVT